MDEYLNPWKSTRFNAGASVKLCCEKVWQNRAMDCNVTIWIEKIGYETPENLLFIVEVFISSERQEGIFVCLLVCFSYKNVFIGLKVCFFLIFFSHCTA